MSKPMGAQTGVSGRRNGGTYLGLPGMGSDRAVADDYDDRKCRPAHLSRPSPRRDGNGGNWPINEDVPLKAEAEDG